MPPPISFDNWPAALDCPYGPYRGIVLSNHDGDTVTILCDCGLDETPIREARIYGIQAPELHEPGGPEARDALSGMIPYGTLVRVDTLLTTKREQQRSFIRYVSSLESEVDGVARDVAARMVAAGHAFWCDRNLKKLPGPPPPIARWKDQSRP